MRASRRLHIGVFHALGDFSAARRTSINHCKYLEKYQPDHDYLYHHVADPVTPALRRMRFDAVLFDVTFLCHRWARPHERFRETVERYRFLAEQDAVRLAFPQDEYDHGELLDEWLAEYRVDAVYSVLWDAWDLIYPRTRQTGQLLRGLTGYVDDADVARMGAHALRFAERTIDVSYRARDLPANFGRYGQLKAELGRRFVADTVGLGLRLDISSRPEDVLLGEDWYRLLGRSRFVLGSEGGSSLWDPRGELRARVEAYVATHPGVTYPEIEEACFPSGDRQPPFSAISPRLFEVAAARAAQILVRAPYLGRLQPDIHYLALEPDLSNVAEVASRLSDHVAAQRMIEACYEELIAPDTYRYSRHAREVMNVLVSELDRKQVRSQPEFSTLADEHRAAVARARAGSPLRQLERRLRRALPVSLKRALKPTVAPLERWLRGWNARRGP